MAYGLSHRLRFYNFLNNDLVDVQISTKDYSGSVTTLLGAENAVSLDFRGKARNAPGIYAVAFKIKLQATTYTQHDIFFNYDRDNFKVDVYIAGQLFIGGLFIEPGLGAKPVTHIHVTSLVASTGIGYLQKIEFRQSDGTMYRDKMTLYEALYKCLALIDPTPKFYDATDIFGTDDHSSSPLVKESFNPLQFRKSWNETKYCYEVIEEILELKHAKMYKYRDGWYIVPVDYKEATINFRVLEGATGTQTTTLSGVSISREITEGILDPALINTYINQSARIDVDHPWRSATVEHDLGYNNNLFRPWFESDFTLRGNMRVLMDLEKEEMILRLLSNENDFAITRVSYYLGYYEAETAKRLLHIKIVATAVAAETRVRVLLIDNNGAIKYVRGDGHWEWSGEYVGIFSEPTTLEVSTIEDMPATGRLFVEFAMRSTGAFPNSPQHTTIDLGSTEVGFANIDNIAKTKSYTQKGSANVLYQQPTIKILLGDAESANAVKIKGMIYDGVLYSYNASTQKYSPIYEFYDAKLPASTHKAGITAILAKRYMLVHSRARFMLTGNFIGHFLPLENMYHRYRTYAFSAFKYDLRMNIWSGVSAYEIDYTATGDYIEVESGIDWLQLESANTDIIQE